MTALVARWTLLHVDGGRCYLPDPGRMDASTTESVIDGHGEMIACTAATSEVAVARLLNDIIGRPEPWQMDRYMKQVGIIEIPDS